METRKGIDAAWFLPKPERAQIEPLTITGEQPLITLNCPDILPSSTWLNSR